MGNAWPSQQAPDPGTLLELHRAEIAVFWAQAAQQMGDSDYQKRPIAELEASATQALRSIAEALSMGCYIALESYLAAISVNRLRQGFDIGEVIEALVLLKETTLRVIGNRLPDGSSEAREALGQIDACLRYMVGRAGHLYAEAMHDDLREQQKHTALMLYAVQMAGSSLELSEVLGRVADSITLAVGGRYCCIYLLDDERGVLVPSAEAIGTRNADRRIPRLPFLTPSLDPLIRELLERKEPVSCQDARADPQVSDQTARALGWKSVLAVPIKIGDRVLGAAVISTFRKPYVFTDEQIALCSGIANAVAVAIENARLYRQVEHLAVMEERQRLARELHDSVTQSLFSVTLYAEAASRMLAAQDLDTTAEHLRELQATAQEALREMRLLIFELRPPLLAQQGLVPALQSRLEGVERRAGLRAELQVAGEKRLPVAVEEELYRIAQEALNNVLKHARAQQVTLRLEFAAQSALLEVSDDGVGFEPTSAGEGGGLGLRGMAERAQRVGGRLTVQSAPGEGTVVRVVVAHGRPDPSVTRLPARI